jgi:hypothetical protein
MAPVELQQIGGSLGRFALVEEESQGVPRTVNLQLFYYPIAWFSRMSMEKFDYPEIPSKSAMIYWRAKSEATGACRQPGPEPHGRRK